MLFVNLLFQYPIIVVTSRYQSLRAHASGELQCHTRGGGAGRCTLHTHTTPRHTVVEKRESRLSLETTNETTKRCIFIFCRTSTVDVSRQCRCYVVSVQFILALGDG